jgi:hypothetical protein
MSPSLAGLSFPSALASGRVRRYQLAHDTFAIQSTQPVDEHRHRQLSAVLALQGRQGAPARRLTHGIIEHFLLDIENLEYPVRP